MVRRIVIIQGHPDVAGGHLCHALAAAYADGAREAGHEVQRIDIAPLDLGYLRRQDEWRQATSDPAVRAAQEAVRWADHLVVLYPLWLGDMPALLKSFLEHLSRGGFAISQNPDGSWTRNLKGKSARVVVTMGMPALIYRWYYFAHSLRSLKRNFLAFSGMHPVRETVLGMVDGAGRAGARARWLHRMRQLGARAL